MSLPQEYSARLDALVQKGVFVTYSEAVRRAIELLLEEYRERWEDSKKRNDLFRFSTSQS